MDAIVQALLDHATREWSAISGAPIAFLACVLLVAAIEWKILGWFFQHEISQRDGTIRIHEERHKAKDEMLAHLSAKADSASPDELKIAVRKLSEEFKKQQQRMISGEQWQLIDVFLRKIPYHERLQIKFNIKLPYNDLEAERYAGDFARIFNCTTSNDAKIGPELTGLIVRIKEAGVIPSAAQQLSSALNVAGIRHRIDSLELQFPIEPPSDFELIIGRNA